jgi:hypothetical protein
MEKGKNAKGGDRPVKICTAAEGTTCVAMAVGD